MNRRIERWRLLAYIAGKDLWHDRKVSLCMVAALVAVITPLLLLFGLKHGVVFQLQDDLLSDPRNLQVRMISSGSYNDDWIESLRNEASTGFVIGMTRSLNTQADLIVGGSRFVENAELVPTAEGDPLLGALALTTPLGDHSVVLSEPAARRLELTKGDTLRLMVNRRFDGRDERGELRVRVAGILAPERFSRPAAFVSLPLLVALEKFRDGYLIPTLGVATGKPLTTQAPTYARVRLYASDIDQVKALEEWLNAHHIDTLSRLADIENVKAISHVLGLIFGVIAVTALIGCVASMLGAFLANIDRKRKDLAVLRLLGFQKPAVAGYIALQAITLALVAYATGLLLYLGGSSVFNHTLSTVATTDNMVCHITPVHAMAALLMSLALALGVAATGALRAFRIEPAESLREL